MKKPEEKTQEASMTKLIKCACKQTFQDQRYGDGIRLHNRGKIVGRSYTWVCTSCNKRV